MFFYHIGDIVCRFDSELMCSLYQKSMNLSLKYDEKINWWFWKEPLNKSNNL